MLVLDTDVLSIWQQRSGPEYPRLEARVTASGQPLYTSIVSFEEQMRGWLKYIAGAKTPGQQVAAYARLRGLFDDFGTRSVLDYDDRAAAEFKQIARVRIGTMDLRIAAVALASDAILITRNLSDFRKVPGLRAEDWTIQ